MPIQFVVLTIGCTFLLLWAYIAWIVLDPPGEHRREGESDSTRNDAALPSMLSGNPHARLDGAHRVGGREKPRRTIRSPLPH